MSPARFAAAALMAVAVVGYAGPSPAQSYLMQGSEQFFRVQWEAGKSRRGAPIVSGYVYNTYGSSATRVGMLVEPLDAAGKVIEQRVYPIAGDIPNDGRLYFELTVPPAAQYRVKVASWDWLRGGGGS
jgi:hypothetical protein